MDKKVRGKSRKWTEAQIKENAKPDIKAADALSRRLGGNVARLWNAKRENEQK